MKAAILYGKEDIRVEDVEIPNALDNGLIIKVECASICNTTDNLIYRSDDPSKIWPYKKFPFILGHECSGKIVEIGKKLLNKFNIGERIAFWCMGYGAFAEFTQIFPEYLAITKISDNIKPEIASIMEMVTGTLRLLISNEDFFIKKGDNVCIFGMGPSGLLYLQEAKILGAKNLICFDHSDFKLIKAKEFGAEITINTEKEKIDRILEEFKGKIDMIIDACGGDIIEHSYKLLKEEGIYIGFGVPKNEEIENKRNILKDKKIKIITTTEMKNAQRAIEIGKEWIEKNELKIYPLITHRIKLEEIKKGLDLCYFERKTTLKVIVEV
jgi:threonine dehydrogenase-like Zn-dependent dehydrogenase